MKHIGLMLLIATLLCQGTRSYAGSGNDEVIPPRPDKQLTATRITGKIVIDGDLSEPEWAAASIANDFIQHNPNLGADASQQSEVKVLYDDNAIYIGAVLYDVSPDSILRELNQRDNEGNTDIFGVFLDTYNDDQNAFGFVVHPTGVQWDARYSVTGQDVSWDAVWWSEVKIKDTNWYVEMMIPYSAIRFPNEAKQVWGINFARKIRRIREFSFWNYIDPGEKGFANQFGELHGLENIKSPVRLSLTPYVSGYTELQGDGQGGITPTYGFSGGADVKYGINESFTLDMTLIPDFSQVQSDNIVFNLTPFEVQYNERRPFFMEGTELFNKSNLFYSRRVGGLPIGFFDVYGQLQDGETVVSNPLETQLINATKVTGRTNRNLGIGVFNAVTASTFAEIETANGGTRKVMTNPVTNYSTIVLDQAIRQNSYFTFINTNVTRNGTFRDANVTGAHLTLINKANTYGIEARGNLSQTNMATGNNQYQADLGHEYYLSLSKVSGNFQFQLSNLARNETYDPNDMGYLSNNNSISYTGAVAYNIYKPFWKMLNFYSNLSFNYSQLYAPREFTGTGISFEAWSTTRKWLSLGVWSWHSPIAPRDYFEPRIWGRYVKNPPYHNIGAWFSSDYRKKFALDGKLSMALYQKMDGYPSRKHLNYSIEPRWRVSNQFSLIYEYNQEMRFSDVGVALYADPTQGIALARDTSLFGERDVKIKTNILSASYVFTNRMGITFRVRHYWLKANYLDFHALQEDGTLTANNYDGRDPNGNSLHNVNYNAFNIDMVYRWRFSPGSELSFTYKNAIRHQETQLIQNYFTDINTTLQAAQNNSFTLKILYYIDYWYLKRGI